MQKDEEKKFIERQDPPLHPPVTKRPADERKPETARYPAPHIKHEPEPDAENIMPAEDEPGTL
jgi:hypothetical protein